MTPFGEKLRLIREDKKTTQYEMARRLNVSSAYLSALENGKRGKPSFQTIENICGAFGIIWDAREELYLIAQLSHPKIVIDTTKLSSIATEVANRLAMTIAHMSEKDLHKINKSLTPRS